MYRPDALAQAAFVASTGGVGREDVRALAAARATGANAARAIWAGRAGCPPSGRGGPSSCWRGPGRCGAAAGGARGRPDRPGPPRGRGAAEAHEEGERREMRAYAETDGCRRAFILSHFGEPFEGPCGRCDNDRRPGAR